MEVEDGLLGAGAAVEDGAVVGVAEFGHHVFGDQEQAADEGDVPGIEVVEGGDRFFGDHQKMHGGLGLDVVDDDVLFILVFDFGGNLSTDDFGEKGFGHGVKLT